MKKLKSKLAVCAAVVTVASISLGSMSNNSADLDLVTDVKSVFKKINSTTTTGVVTGTATLPIYDININKNEATALAQMAWGEARGCSTMEIAATMWCVLNRVDSSGYGMGRDVMYVVTFPNQFLGYSPNNPVTDKLYDLAVDVLTRWQMEKQGASAEEVGRVLPSEYMFFHGDGKQNWFRTSYAHNGAYWNWSLENPYEME